MNNRVKSVTLTMLTESPVALSNDQGYGNYTPIKKYFFKDGLHAMTSVATLTYELRSILHREFGWGLGSLILNEKNIVPKLDENNLEFDVFGYLIPDKQISKTSPLRIIPFRSIHTYKNDTQLITNRGFLNKDFGRVYFEKKNEQLVKFPEDKELPTTQALANEEVFGDYYVYTVTIELDRIGLIETKDGKYLDIDKREYLSKETREKAVKDILEALTILTRDIKHQRVLLKPLAVFGGAFKSALPYFWDDIEFDKYDNFLILDRFKDTVESYGLEKNNLLLAVDRRINKKLIEKVIKEDILPIEKDSSIKIKIETSPVKAIKELATRLSVKDEDNYWYLGDGNPDE